MYIHSVYVDSDVVSSGLADAAGQPRLADDSDLTSASDLDTSVMEKWRDISYTHADHVTAETAAPSLSADPRVSELFSMESDDDTHAQVCGTVVFGVIIVEKKCMLIHFATIQYRYHHNLDLIGFCKFSESCLVTTY